jgi:hypothetical protein
MSRKLVIFTLAGLATCALSLGLAVAIGGENIFHDPRSMAAVRPLIDLATHKTWSWGGGDTLALDAPINIRYQPKGPAQVTVTGPAEVVQHVQVSEGRIASDTGLTRHRGPRAEAVISGIPIRKFVVHGGERLDLGEIKQPALDLHINGTGVVTGSGEVDRLNMVIAGPGKASLGGLNIRDDAKVTILGNGDAALAPHGDLRLFIAGNGKLAMTSKPKNVSQTILGSGEINEMSQDAARQAVGAVDAGRIASEAAQSAIQATLGEGSIGRIASEAARKGIENAQIERHVREGIERGLAGIDRGEVSQTDGSVTVRSSHSVDVGHIEQQHFKVTILDAGSVTAEGKVDRLKVEVMASGHANLGRIAARDVDVTIAGSGDVTVAPSENLKVMIMGSGDVRLLTRPANIKQQIMGSGHIIYER